MSVIRLFTFTLFVVMYLTACGGDTWRDHDGNRVSDEDLEGRLIIVNYWAEWCAPCREEIPEFNALAAQHPDIAVLGVNYDRLEGDTLKSVAEEMDIQFPVLGHDFAAAFSLPHPQVVPTTYILDSQRNILHTLLGPQSKETILALAEKAPGADDG